MTPGKGLVVHVETCNNVAELRRRSPREIIPSRWSSPTQGEFETTLDVGVNRRKGVVAELANAVNAADAGINNITVDERTAELSRLRLEVSVRDKEHLERVRQRLLSVAAVQSVESARRPRTTSSRTTEGRRASTSRTHRCRAAGDRHLLPSPCRRCARPTFPARYHSIPNPCRSSPGGIRREVEQVLANLAAVAVATGGGLGDVVKLTVYLTDLNDFETVNQVMAGEFDEPYPARAAVQVAALPRGRPGRDRRGARTARLMTAPGGEQPTKRLP